MEEKCSFCNTTYKEILESGFVGCDKCYYEIEPLRNAIDKLYGGKTHKGRSLWEE